MHPNNIKDGKWSKLTPVHGVRFMPKMFSTPTKCKKTIFFGMNIEQALLHVCFRNTGIQKKFAFGV